MFKKIQVMVMTTLLVASWLMLRAAAGHADVILSQDQPLDLYGNSSKASVGDVLTVNLRETVTVDTSVSTTRKRKSEWKAGAGAGLLSFLPSLEKVGSSTREDKNTDKQTQTITSSMTVRVISVEANGNLVLEGSRMLWGNGRKVAMSLRGVARPVDINPDNSISSNRLLNLAIRVDGLMQSQPVDLVRTVFGTSPTE